jgi:hypothetical protein
LVTSRSPRIRIYLLVSVEAFVDSWNLTASARDLAADYEDAVSISTISMLLAFEVDSVDNGRNGLAQGFLLPRSSPSVRTTIALRLLAGSKIRRAGRKITVDRQTPK